MAPVIAGFWERAEFPFALLPSFGQLGLCGGTIKGYGCPVRALRRGGATRCAALGVPPEARARLGITSTNTCTEGAAAEEPGRFCAGVHAGGLRPHTRARRAAACSSTPWAWWRWRAWTAA